MPASFSFGVCIHRSMDNWNHESILGIKLSRLWEIYRHIGATALVLYLYLYSHPDGTQMVLSASAVHAATGMPDSTCRDQITKGDFFHRGEEP